MERQPFSNSFLVPVSKKSYPDYHTIIREPMDLHSMKRKVQDLKYSSADEFMTDLQLIVNNCVEYSGRNSAVAAESERLWNYVQVSNHVVASQFGVYSLFFFFSSTLSFYIFYNCPDVVTFSQNTYGVRLNEFIESGAPRAKKNKRK